VTFSPEARTLHSVKRRSCWPICRKSFLFRPKNTLDGGACSLRNPASFLSGRRSAGSAGEFALTRKARASEGLRHWRGTELAASNCHQDFDNAAMQGSFLFSFGKLQAWRISSFRVKRRSLRSILPGVRERASTENKACAWKPGPTCDGVRRFRGNPDSAERGHDPGALRGADGHHATASENQLIFEDGNAPGLRGHPRVAGDSRDLGVRTALFIEEDACALCRHLLSQ